MKKIVMLVVFAAALAAKADGGGGCRGIMSLRWPLNIGARWPLAS